ncbi:MAG: 3-phosphoshikimate 1-carboxyvinyltransferase [Acidobacteriota bacterium]
MKSIKSSLINGSIKAPPSKSMTIRAAAGALLSQGKTQILTPSQCQDAQTAFQIIQDLGATIQPVPQGIKIKGGLNPRKDSIQCGESGLCLRLFTPIASLLSKELTLKGKGSLSNRPMDMMESPLKSLGLHCKTQNGLPPIKAKGPLGFGEVNMDGSLTSQFLSGLLMALPLCKGNSEIRVQNLNSKPYILMTLELLHDFGIKVNKDKGLSKFQIPGNQKYSRAVYPVEGDWSGASFLLAAGAISGKVTVTGLNMKSAQADKQILKALHKTGANIQMTENKVTVSRNKLKSLVFDATHCPDLIPALTVLACFSPGLSKITGASRLKYKESNRALSLISEFQKMGADIWLDKDKLLIRGGNLEGGKVFSHNDHRIAMAEAIAGLRVKKSVRIHKWECVEKSYPNFFKDLISIGGRIK